MFVWVNLFLVVVVGYFVYFAMLVLVCCDVFGFILIILFVGGLVLLFALDVCVYLVFDLPACGFAG